MNTQCKPDFRRQRADVVAVLLMLFSAIASASVDLNNASATQLDCIQGIGPTYATKIVGERSKGAFQSWRDFQTRMKVGEDRAVKWSRSGLAINGEHLDKFHYVRPGETLSAIAKQYYGSTEAVWYESIFEANRALLENPDHIYTGQRLRLPPLGNLRINDRTNAIC